MTTADETRLQDARSQGRAVLREGLRAGIYTRMSMARMDDKTKVEDQERICRELAERRGWDIAGSYCDNNKSAWQRNRKRKDWDRMLADVEAARLDVIIVYHGDRLIRQPYDLECLINLAYGKGIMLASPTGQRDLSNPDDLFILRVEAAAGCRESDSISRRKKAQHERERRQGLPHHGGRGGRPFGYEPDGITLRPADRCDVRTRLPVTEQDILREMARRVLAGESSGSVGRDVTGRGWRTPAGKPIDDETVRRWLTSPRYAALMPDGESKAAWAPVFDDRETYERLRLVLDQRGAPYRGRSGARKHLLSGISYCGAPDGDGECGAPLEIRRHGRASALGKPYAIGYTCSRRGCGKVFRRADMLEAYVKAAVLGRLGSPDSAVGHAPGIPGAEVEWAALGRERAETEALLLDYRKSAGRARTLMTRLDQIDERMAELRELESGDARSRLLGTYRGITLAEFDGLPLDVRQALVRACYRVVVLPTRKGRGFRTEDVRLDAPGA